jgi:GNAT superfamily N-acetyltransferase
MTGVIRPCTQEDSPAILSIINEAAEAYRGVIPADRWHEPYMSMESLEREIAAGVEFWGQDVAGQLIGIMGVQPVDDVDLIRHAYVRREWQGRGIGRALLTHLRERTDRPILIGTWAAADWAIRFYQGNGFELVPAEETAQLLRRYWSIPERQIETSVVLADSRRGQRGP